MWMSRSMSGEDSRAPEGQEMQAGAAAGEKGEETLPLSWLLHPGDPLAGGAGGKGAVGEGGGEGQGGGAGEILVERQRGLWEPGCFGVLVRGFLGGGEAGGGFEMGQLVEGEWAFLLICLKQESYSDKDKF